MDFDYVTNCRKELVEKTVDIERSANIVVKGGKYVMFIGKEVLRGMEGMTRSSGRTSCAPSALPTSSSPSCT